MLLPVSRAVAHPPPQLPLRPSRPPSLPPPCLSHLPDGRGLLPVGDEDVSLQLRHLVRQPAAPPHPRESQPPGGQPSRQTPTDQARPTTTRSACSGQLRRRAFMDWPAGCQGMSCWWWSVAVVVCCVGHAPLSDLPGVHDGDGGQALLLVHHREAQRARVDREHALECLHARQDSQQTTQPSSANQRRLRSLRGGVMVPTYLCIGEVDVGDEARVVAVPVRDRPHLPVITSTSSRQPRTCQHHR